MRSKFKWKLAFVLMLIVQFSFSQGKTITGVVTDEVGPVVGANVVVKGTKNGTNTDFDGKFIIKASQGDVLEFSYLGMKTQSVTVGTSSTINVAMKADVVNAAEVVLVAEGYDRTRTKAQSMVAATTIDAEVLQNRPNASFMSSLQGSTPGASIASSSGSPGSSKLDAIVRGISSLSGSTDPLIVIDGVPIAGNQFRNLNQNDFESVTLLRDAAATSIYGNKGANGVFVIKTKSASFNAGGGVKFAYDAITGINSIPENKYGMMNSKQALTLEKTFGAGLGSTLSDAEIAAWDIETDWRDEFFRIGLTQQHNLAVSSSSANTSNYTSLGYFNQDGMVPTTDFQRFTLRNNLSGKSTNEKFNYGVNTTVGYSKRNQLNQESNSGVDNNTIQNPLHGSIMGLPYAEAGIYNSGQELVDAIGTNFAGANDTYVLADILRDGSLPSYFTESNLLASAFANYKLTKDITLGNKFGVDYKQNDGVFARAPQSYLAIVVKNIRGEEFGGFEDMSTVKDFTFTNIMNLNYSKVFKDVHTLDAGVYFEYVKSHRKTKFQRQNGLNPLTYVPGAGTGYVAFNPANPNSFLPSVSASEINAGTLSYFATLDYDYNERFGFSGVVRRDATYRFVDDKKWGTFWSASGRWNIDKESFMEGSAFNMLKLRASIGTQGNQNIIASASGVNPLFTANDIVRDLIGSGNGYNNQQGVFVSQIANTTLQWEEINQTNVGIDFEVLNSRLRGNVDVYEKSTSRLFSSDNTSAATSLFSQVANNGKISNRGIELSLKYKLFNVDGFNFNVFANGSYNKSEVVDVVDADLSQNLVNSNGQMIYEWNLIPYVGVNQNNGNLLYLDANDQLTETPDQVADRRFTGKSIIPVYTGGFGFNSSYKGFFADALFSWAYDVWRIDNQLRWAYDVNQIGDDNLSSDLLNAWTAENPTNFPSLSASNTSLDADSDRYLKDASFLRLKNVSVGYNFPASFLKGTFMSSLRVYAQAENMLTWTKWRGFDPEARTALSVTNYPNPKTVSFGASVQF